MGGEARGVRIRVAVTQGWAVTLRGEAGGAGHAQLATPKSREKGRSGRGVVSPEAIEVTRFLHMAC